MTDQQLREQELKTFSVLADSLKLKIVNEGMNLVCVLVILNDQVCVVPHPGLNDEQARIAILMFKAAASLAAGNVAREETIYVMPNNKP